MFILSCEIDKSGNKTDKRNSGNLKNNIANVKDSVKSKRIIFTSS